MAQGWSGEIAGRLHWHDRDAKWGRRAGLAVFRFSSGTLVLTEAGSKRRASLVLVGGAAGLAAHDPGGLEPLDADRVRFEAVLRSTNHTLKRALTDPRLFSGIGNAYSDEILHRARLSPFLRCSRLGREQLDRLYDAVQACLREWIERLWQQAGGAFPKQVTAFRDRMAVHGRYRKPCPVCGAPIQRLVYAEREANYCPRCQTGGRVLRDRALSRLLRDD